MSNESTPSSLRKMPSLRKISNRFTDPIAEKIHRQIPKLTPDHLTAVGLAGAITSLTLNYYAQKNNSPRLGRVALGLFITSSSLDLLDGALAREIKNKDGYHDSQRGGIIDSVSDRLAETVAAGLRNLHAKDTYQPLGIITAGLVGISNLFPSLFRAIAESAGKFVPHAGKNPLDFLGTRPGRFGATIFSNFFPKVKNKNIQPVVDSVTSLANIATAVQRLKIYKDKNIKPSLSEDEIFAAEKRKKALLATSIFGSTALAIITIANLLAINQNEN